MFELKDVSKSFGEKSVLRGIYLKADGETVALMGESGSGKTTAMRIIAGLEKADGGEVIADGKTAVVFAEPRLFENASVIENITCVMERTMSKEEKNRLALELLDELLMSDAAYMYPSELSSGMAARVSIARALASGADNFLLDEPFGALDDAVREKVTAVAKDRLKGKSVLLITHSEGDAKALASRTLILSDGKISI